MDLKKLIEEGTSEEEAIELFKKEYQEQKLEYSREQRGVFTDKASRLKFIAAVFSYFLEMGLITKEELQEEEVDFLCQELEKQEKKAKAVKKFLIPILKKKEAELDPNDTNVKLLKILGLL